jgi:hypothetical protein
MLRRLSSLALALALALSSSLAVKKPRWPRPQ